MENRLYLKDCLISKELNPWAWRSENNGLARISNIKLYLVRLMGQIIRQEMVDLHYIHMTEHKDQDMRKSQQVNAFSIWLLVTSLEWEEFSYVYILTCSIVAGSIWHATVRHQIRVYNFNESSSSIPRNKAKCQVENFMVNSLERD